MARLKPITRQQLKQRREQLRHTMRQKLRIRIWRFVLTTGFLAAGIYGARAPIWKIQDTETVRIKGNQLLSEEDILALAPPISSLYIWQVEPSQVEAALLRNPLLKSVAVRRHLFPPHVSAIVQERQAVAIGETTGTPGFIDAEGHWIALAMLPAGEIPSNWPTVKAVGWQNQREADWAELLFVLQYSKVEIQEVDWSSPSNLILQTEVGEVHLGALPEGTPPDSPRGTSPLGQALKQRIQRLNELHELYGNSSGCNCQPEDIVHIDLAELDFPTVTLTESAQAARFPNPESRDPILHTDE